MPFGTQEVAHCPRCGHAAFHAESVSAAGKQWHKSCYRCGLCKKALETTTVAEHDGNVYCKQCYARKFGIRGVGFGIGAGTLGMDSGERFGHNQPNAYRPNYPPVLGITPPS